MAAERAVLFVDGNNWYHGLRDVGVVNQFGLNYAKIAAKVVGPRMWTETRYYIGRVPQSGNVQLFADQRRFISKLQSTDSRISVHFGRLEPRPVKSEAAEALAAYLANLKVKIDPDVYRDLVRIADTHRKSWTKVEKAVDVMLAVDLVVLAERDQYDTAYIFSADGDFTPAVQFARSLKKKVFAVSASNGARLAKEVDSFIKVDGSWFAGCYDV